MTSQFPSIENESYINFCRLFNSGRFGQQRFGQAFYDWFRLHKMADQAALRNLYERDGTDARALIRELFNLH